MGPVVSGRQQEADEEMSNDRQVDSSHTPNHFPITILIGMHKPQYTRSGATRAVMLQINYSIRPWKNATNYFLDDLALTYGYFYTLNPTGDWE